ncbi:hypothetical protein ACWCP6_07310 [Streptomyces sp. NPDC002004]
MSARRLPTWAPVTALTVAALAAVTVLAVQAKGAAPEDLKAQGPRPSASASAHGGSTPGTHQSSRPKPSQAPVPPHSGDGRRVVYSLGEHRVWLVNADNSLSRSFTVWPGTVSPAAGSYKVTYRRPAVEGSDGVQIENVIYFTAVDGLNVAFSNAQDGSSPKPAPGAKTGGIRLHKEDGAALWKFGDEQTVVRVVP